MPQLVWDDIGDRVYETGLDRGVLYLPDGSGVPWNGLTNVVEHTSKEVSPTYFDGMKIHDIVVLGDFSATMKAVTYPDEFLELEGLTPLRYGVFAGDQAPQVFGLSYRTRVGNDLDPEAGYKIHIIYNVTAVPSDKSYTTLSGYSSLTEFEWNITAIPEEISGLRPTAHFIIDSTKVDSILLRDLEEILYGNVTEGATLLAMSDLVEYILDWV